MSQGRAHAHKKNIIILTFPYCKILVVLEQRIYIFFLIAWFQSVNSHSLGHVFCVVTYGIILKLSSFKTLSITPCDSSHGVLISFYHKQSVLRNVGTWPNSAFKSRAQKDVCCTVVHNFYLTFTTTCLKISRTRIRTYSQPRHNTHKYKFFAIWHSTLNTTYPSEKLNFNNAVYFTIIVTSSVT